MLKLKEGQSISVGVKALYESKSSPTNGEIIPDYDEKGKLNYYDLYNEKGELFCCDGETCCVDQIGEYLITLRNDEGESTVYFTITEDEGEIAIFNT